MATEAIPDLNCTCMAVCVYAVRLRIQGRYKTKAAVGKSAAFVAYEKLLGKTALQPCLQQESVTYSFVFSYQNSLLPLRIRSYLDIAGA
jgi:hypothetical protein